MGRIFYAVVLGGLGALLIHILTIFLIPGFAENDAWARLPKQVEDGYFTLVNRDDPLAASMQAFDQNFVYGACRFGLSEGPFGLAGGTAPTFWSLSVYDRRGINLYSINDKSLQGNDLDVVIATPLQITELQKDMPPELSGSVFVEADTRDGFVLLRSYVPEPGLLEKARTFVSSTNCAPL